MGDFLYCAVEGEGVVWISRDFVDERGRDHVDRDGSCVEHELVVFVGHLGEVGW